MCGPFSSLSNIGKERWGDTENMRNALEEAISHLKFTLEMSRVQVQENKGLFLSEHPWTAKSWAKDVVKEMKNLGGA